MAGSDSQGGSPDGGQGGSGQDAGGSGKYAGSSVTSSRNQSGTIADETLASPSHQRIPTGIRLPEELIKAKALPGRKFEKKSKR